MRYLARCKTAALGLEKSIGSWLTSAPLKLQLLTESKDQKAVPGKQGSGRTQPTPMIEK